MTAPPRPLTVASLPGKGDVNPYVDLLYGALGPANATLYSEPTISLEWGVKHFPAIDALHFHWPEFIWRHGPPRAQRTQMAEPRARREVLAGRLLEAARTLARHPRLAGVRRTAAKWRGVRNFNSFLRAAKAAGVHVLWTVHNIEAHEEWDRVDVQGVRILAAHADVVVCHTQAVARQVRSRYPTRARVVVMPHGNYDGAFPPPRPREAVLAELGLDPRLPVVGCVGGLRPYKGFDVALAAVGRLGNHVQWLCAGHPHPTFPLEQLRREADARGGAAVIAQRLSLQQFVDYCAASDVLLFPYREVTGSGALLAALTLGRAVIASDLPFFREVLLASKGAGVLVPPGNAVALASAIEATLASDPATRAAAARALAERYAWPEVVKELVQALRALERRELAPRGAP